MILSLFFHTLSYSLFLFCQGHTIFSSTILEINEATFFNPCNKTLLTTVTLKENRFYQLKENILNLREIYHQTHRDLLDFLIAMEMFEDDV